MVYAYMLDTAQKIFLPCEMNGYTAGAAGLSDFLKEGIMHFAALDIVEAQSCRIRKELFYGNNLTSHVAQAPVAAPTGYRMACSCLAWDRE
jgi:hypothetical protein